MFDHQTHKYLKFVLVVIMAGLISSCSHLPNPLKGRPKPIKPGPLPELSQPLGISPVWLWQYKLDRASDLAIPPAIGAKQLYIAQAKGIVTALDKLSGQCQWQVTLNAPIATGPTLIGDRLYVATKDAQLFALSTDGKIH
jgi:outer membrane protein assembly factor BamB